MLHCVKRAGSTQVPPELCELLQHIRNPQEEAMVHRQWVQVQINPQLKTQLPFQRDQETVYSGPETSDHSRGRQSQVAPNMFQYGSSCMNFYILTGQQKVLNQDIFQIHWWEHQVSKFQQSGENFAGGLRRYLMAFSASEAVETSGLSQYIQPHSRKDVVSAINVC